MCARSMSEVRFVNLTTVSNRRLSQRIPSMSRLLPISLVFSLFLFLGVAPSEVRANPGLPKYGDPEFECVSSKQQAAARYSAGPRPGVVRRQVP